MGAWAGHAGADSPPLYAGFWRRFWACIVDYLIVYVIPVVALQTAFADSASQHDDIGSGVIGIALVAVLLPHWLYFACFESSKFGATPGKMILRIKVVGKDGQHTSFGRATGRYFAK